MRGGAPAGRTGAPRGAAAEPWVPHPQVAAFFGVDRSTRARSRRVRAPAGRVRACAAGRGDPTEWQRSRLGHGCSIRRPRRSTRRRGEMIMPFSPSPSLLFLCLSSAQISLAEGRAHLAPVHRRACSLPSMCTGGTTANCRVGAPLSTRGRRGQREKGPEGM
jgi:hypothetical protein